MIAVLSGTGPSWIPHDVYHDDIILQTGILFAFFREFYL